LEDARHSSVLSILEDARHSSVLYICKYFVIYILSGIRGFTRGPNVSPVLDQTRLEKMISGVTKVLDQPQKTIKQQCHMISAVYFYKGLQKMFKPIITP
jgi:hypothetical protein